MANQEWSIKELTGILNETAQTDKDNLIPIDGATGCLSENTKLHNHKKTIGELYDSGKIFVNTYSIIKPKRTNGSGAFYPIKSKSEIILSGNKEVYEIELENGKKVYATSEHRFFSNKGNKRIEKSVSELNVGNKLVCYPKDYINNYHKEGNDYVKEIRKRRFVSKRICKKCNNIFFVNSGVKQNKYCNMCGIKSEKLISPVRHWYEWEDNLLRQFYYSYTKEKLMELLPLRYSWKSIQHRANRLNLKRKGEFQWKQNAWTSKNNPIHNPISFEKMMKRQIHIYARNKKTNIEKRIAEFLDSQNIKYYFNKVVRTKTSFKFPDFQIGNLIIECDGLYWHRGKKNSDKQREDELKECGFEIIRFTDKEINHNFGEVKRCIIQKLNQLKK